MTRPILPTWLTSLLAILVAMLAVTNVAYNRGLDGVRVAGVRLISFDRAGDSHLYALSADWAMAVGPEGTSVVALLETPPGIAEMCGPWRAGAVALANPTRLLGELVVADAPAGAGAPRALDLRSGALLTDADLRDRGYLAPPEEAHPAAAKPEGPAPAKPGSAPAAAPDPATAKPASAASGRSSDATRETLRVPLGVTPAPVTEDELRGRFSRIRNASASCTAVHAAYFTLIGVLICVAIPLGLSRLFSGAQPTQPGAVARPAAR